MNGRSYSVMDVFSVYIFIYKNIDNLVKTIESVFVQSYKEIELIISDDCSSENWEEQYGIINKIVAPYYGRFRNVVINVNTKNLGTVKHINKVLPMGIGKYIALLGCGDGFYELDTLQKVINHFETEQTLVCTSRRIMYYSEGKSVVLPGRRICRQFNTSPQQLLDLCCREINHIVTIGSFFRREIFEKYGYYDEEYFLLEDAPFFLKLLFNNERITFINAITCFYEKGGISNRKTVDERLLVDSKKTLEKIKYPNRNKLSFFTRRIVIFKYEMRISRDIIKKIRACIMYPDAVFYMIIFIIIDRATKFRYLD